MILNDLQIFLLSVNTYDPPHTLSIKRILWNIFVWHANLAFCSRQWELHSLAYPHPHPHPYSYPYPADTCSAAERVEGARSAASTTPSACTGTPRWPAPPRSATSPATPVTRAPSAGECAPHLFLEFPRNVHHFHSPQWTHSCRLQETTITTLPNGGNQNGAPISAVDLGHNPGHNEAPPGYGFLPLNELGQQKRTHPPKFQESLLNWVPGRCYGNKQWI